MKMPARNIVAFLLVMIYAMITMSTLAPIALKSTKVTHAATGECSGDCNICGCSAERRTSRTCCCWMKKQQHKHDNDKATCCKKKMPHRMTTISCNCPCGTDRDPGIPGVTVAEHMPNAAPMRLTTFAVENLFITPESADPGITCEPPEPPPKITFFC